MNFNTLQHIVPRLMHREAWMELGMRLLQHKDSYINEHNYAKVKKNEVCIYKAAL